MLARMLEFVAAIATVGTVSWALLPKLPREAIIRALSPKDGGTKS